MVKKRELFLFLALLLLGIFFIYIYGYVKQTQKDIYIKVQANKITQLRYLLKNVEDELLSGNNIKNPKDLTALLSDEKVRQKYEKYLNVLSTPSMKYIYLLSKDEKNRFRFLLDGSKTDKANFYQKFDVTNVEYEELYRTKKAQVIRQGDVENLYLTYLYPVITDNKVIAILSIDLTTKIRSTILKLIKPLETFFVILIIFIFLLMLMTMVQVFHYFITRKKIFTDQLTKLYNRNYLQEILPTINLNQYSIAMLDLDRFKAINDTYGHKAGDYILSQSAIIFKESIRESDIMIRYGGEEFILFIYNRDNDDDSAHKVCERIRENINKHTYRYENQDIKMQVSIGVHENPSLEKNLNEAIKTTDKMLYMAKRDGRNRVVCYDERLTEMSLSKLKDINFVKQALEDNRVICYYQPIYDHNNNKIFKYEALVRIIDTDGAIITPLSFLPTLKHTNLHYKLTQRILSIVFEKFKDSKDFASININFTDLINEDIEMTIKEAFTTNPNLGSRITFEILESDEIDNITLFKQKLTLLHQFKAKVSIDDFGSGYSNFKTILDIEANFLKIDGSLIKNIDKNEKDFKVVKSIINFAKEANMKTIAEFVHSKDVYDKLQLLDIDYMQGYYIAQPLAEPCDKTELFK